MAVNVRISSASVARYEQEAKQEIDKSWADLNRNLQSGVVAAAVAVTNTYPVQTGRLVGSTSVSTNSGGGTKERSLLDPTKSAIVGLIQADAKDIDLKRGDTEVTINNTAPYGSYAAPDAEDKMARILKREIRAVRDD